MRYLFIFLSFLAVSSVCAQQISGTVRDAEGKALPGANVWYIGTTTGMPTADDGSFALPLPVEWPAKVGVQYIGFVTDTLELDAAPNAPIEITLQAARELQTIDIEARSRGTNINTIDPVLVEQVNEKELTRAACCNLSESFETNASVDVQATDAVSGSKTIRMLGLDGIYTQILFENMPYVRGLSGAYGLTYVPGTWPESIQIIKGRGSVVNGYESMAGSINLEMHKPDKADPLFVNLYGSSMGRLEANVHAATELNDKWSTMLFLHGSMVQVRNDRNHDGFLDMPLREQVNVFNRWKYFGRKYRAQFGIRALSEDVQGGQTAFDYASDYGLTGNYGVGIRARQLEVWGKNGILFSPKTSLGILASARLHNQQSYFGNREYDGEQRSGYVNAILQSEFSEAHRYKVGASYVLDDYNESFSDSAFSRTEHVPGVFAEYTFVSDDDKWAAVAGVRTDFHNLYGTRVSPSFNLKWSPRPLTALRVSAGRGFRTANALVEQASVLASSRRLIVKETLQPEQSWNVGASFTKKFPFLGMESYLLADYFYTWFENRVVVDLETWREVRFYNLQGESYANSAQLEFGTEPLPGLELKAAYKWYDVRTTYRGTLKRQLLVPEHRAFFNAAYETQNKRWRFDGTVQWVAAARIPYLPETLGDNVVREVSESYMQINAQATRVWKRWEIYLGCENLTNYQQPAPILSPDNPFGADFDASMIWGRVMGRNIYGGLRMKILKKKSKKPCEQ